MTNAALFSTVAREYATFRPGYPPELFAWLARIVPARGAVWDCGCGNGQASVPLADYFARVHATDVAAEQIDVAQAHPRVTYSVAPAEHSGLGDASVDLVTVAQALHWFDVVAFYAEVRRVGTPGAVLAVWNYPRPRFEDEAMDRLFNDFYTKVVGPYWPPERRHIESNYTTLPFPFTEIEHPPFALDLDWPIERVVGYVSSWSATARYKKALGTDPVPAFAEKLARAWPAGQTTLRLSMPLGLRAAKILTG
jgi:SAM-dependent methyltransferase